MSDATIWTIIVAVGIGTFLLRFSFLGVLGAARLPDWVLRHLRYTAVAVLPGLVAPLVLWPAGSARAGGAAGSVARCHRGHARPATFRGGGCDCGGGLSHTERDRRNGCRGNHALRSFVAYWPVRIARSICAAATDLSSLSVSRYSEVCTPGTRAN